MSDIELIKLNKTGEAVKTSIKEYVRAMEINTKRLPQTIWLARKQGGDLVRALEIWANDRNKSSPIKIPAPLLSDCVFRGIPVRVQGARDAK